MNDEHAINAFISRAVDALTGTVGTVVRGKLAILEEGTYKPKLYFRERVVYPAPEDMW